MEYQSAILSDIKKKNRKSFRMMAVFSIIIYAVMGSVLMLQDQDTEYMSLIVVVMSGAAIFTIMIWGGIYLSGITYTTLKKESNYFETEKLKRIDADYTAATIFRDNCRVGELYVYGYYKASFLLIPIRQIESLQVEHWATKPTGHMIIMNKHNGARCMIGAFEHKQDALQITNQIVQQNSGITMK